MNKAYENLIQKLINVIDKLAPFKIKRITDNLEEWFDGEVPESLTLRYKLFNKFKSSKLNPDK